MNCDSQKDWTILFYLNGNNELAPEMFQSRAAIEKEGSDDNTDVLIQHGTVERRIVEIIRPQYQFLSTGEYSGVRRYHTDSEKYEDLGNLNMADPKCLYDFVEWGMTNYPAKRYMLILGGHVFQYVGLMPDYSGNLPYLMGYPGMTNALYLIKRNLDRKIDLLVLDTCYVNRIEMLYELGKETDPPVDSVLTYTSGGPISGLPYDNLIKAIKKHGSDAVLNNVIHKIIDSLNRDLIAYEINHDKLEKIKKLYSDIACCILNSHYPSHNPSELLTTADRNFPWHDSLAKLSESMPSLTLCHKNVSNKPFSHFYVSAQTISDPHKISLYNRLAFAKNNFWSHLLYINSDSAVNNSDEADAGLDTIILKPGDLFALITAMNPGCNAEHNKEKLQELIKYKGWVL